MSIDNIVSTLNGIIGEKLLVVLLFAAGIYFTIRLRGIQFSMLKESVRVLSEKPKEKNSISSFQTLMLTTGARVGAGNIVGVASAITMGGAGSVFWMWLMTLLGGATSFIESTLAQIYKRKSNDEDGTCYGGPAFYIQDGLHARWLGIVFSIFLFLTYSVGFNMVCSYNLADSFSFYFGSHEAFYATPIPYIVGVAVAVIVGICLFGGGRRLAKVSEILVPIMSTVFLLFALIIILKNITNIPNVFVLIFTEAFNFKAIFGGFAGSCLMYGIKRGLFSNEAGVGSAPNAAASAEVRHPAKQGLVQMLSVFIDTLVICTATAFICLSSGIQPDESIAGVGYVQAAAANAVGNVGYWVVTLSVVLFTFTSMIGNLSYCTSAWKFIFKNGVPKYVIVGYRLFGVVIIFVGSIMQASTIWNIADLLMACMCIINIPTIFILGNKAVKAFEDYKKQKKAGKEPEFHASTVGLNNTECWK